MITYVHGLESGPHGTKHAFLQSAFDVEVRCVDMQMSKWSLRKRNSMGRNLLRHAWRVPPWKLGRHAILSSMRACLNAQRDAFDQSTVVVGSSWGGAVTLLGMSEGWWTGPTVLLAPAYAKAARVFGMPESMEPARLYRRIRPYASNIHIFHGEDDEVVPLADSLDLAAAVGCGLTIVKQGDHRLNQTLCRPNSDLVKWLARHVPTKAVDGAQGAD